MSYLDLAAASTRGRDGTSYVVGGLRPSYVVRQTSLSHSPGDRIEGAAFAQFGVLADTWGSELPGQTLRATSLDAISRSFLHAASHWKSDAMHRPLVDAIRPISDTLALGEECATITGLAGAVVEWPYAAVASAGEMVVVVATLGSVRVASGRLGPAPETSSASVSEISSWQEELSTCKTLIVGNGAFARAWTEASLSDELDKQRGETAGTIAESLVGPAVLDRSAASVLVARVVDGEAPPEISAESAEADGLGDADEGITKPSGQREWSTSACVR